MPFGNLEGGCDHCGRNLFYGHAPSCPVLHAPKDEKPSADRPQDSQAPFEKPWRNYVTVRGMTDEEWDTFQKSTRPMLEGPQERLIAALIAQTKAIEEYTKATSNLTIHIGLLVQAMADDRADQDEDPALGTLS